MSARNPKRTRSRPKHAPNGDDLSHSFNDSGEPALSLGSKMNQEQAPLSSHSNSSGNSVRILIADDFPQWRKVIRQILSSRPEWEIIAEAGDGQQAVEKAIELHPDVVLLDIGMPVMNGLQAAAAIRQHCPGTRIIFVTQTDDEAVREAALDLGAAAYLLKINASVELVPLVAAAQGILRKQESEDGAILSGV